MKIAFHTNQIGLRGSEIALYDYAKFNEDLLGHESVIVYPSCHKANVPQVIQKFSSRFRTVAYSDFSQVDPLLVQNKIDKFYMIKSGFRDGIYSSECENLVHAMFPTFPWSVHGERFAYVSEWLSKRHLIGKKPFVPHIVNLPRPTYNLRLDLNIPRSALVVGGYGGEDSFDVKAAREGVRKTLARRSDIYFVFMNFIPFIQHERVLFLPGNSDLQYKSNFIEACDAMLHARKKGESFGLACGEFSIMNKPVITFSRCQQKSHIEILGNKAILYGSSRELTAILVELDRKQLSEQHWDCYSASFGPVPVMNKFRDVFLAN